MIVGSGDIASVLPNKEGIIYFASGVSNSQETRESEYCREINLLLEQDRDSRLVYFSSLCIYYAQTRYAFHKCQMEKIVRAEFPAWTIIRLGNITWGDNPHTLINHLQHRNQAGLPLEIQDTDRYIVDKPEFLHWINLIPCWNTEINIPGRKLSVRQIVDQYVI